MATRLLVGLGNPSPQYTETRHNVGIDFLQHLASAHTLEFSRSKLADHITFTQFLNHPMDPPLVGVGVHTYMNESGPALLKFMKKDGMTAPDILVMVDDFAIPFGTVRLRPDGSAGGHNGLKSIIEAFGSDAFPRLRIGVGPVPSLVDPAHFVLEKFSKSERDGLPKIFDSTAKSLLVYLTEGLNHGMNAINKSHLT